MTLAATHGFDVVFSPVAPVAAFPAEWHGPTNDPGTAMAHIGYTAPYNFSEQPAATVNAGSTRDGRPIGLQLAGRRFGDVGVVADLPLVRIGPAGRSPPDLAGLIPPRAVIS